MKILKVMLVLLLLAVPVLAETTINVVVDGVTVYTQVLPADNSTVDVEVVPTVIVRTVPVNP